MNKWISVEEMLPKKHGDILPQCRRVLVLDGRFVDIGRYDYETKTWLTYEDLKHVTYWQPLPDPPY